MIPHRAFLHLGNSRIPVGSSTITIGRDPESSIVIDSPDVSRQHALIVPNGTRWIIIDFKSANGTKLNHRYVTWSILQDGDTITIGDTTFRFSCLDEGIPGEDHVVHRIRAGRLDLLTLAQPAQISPQLRVQDPHLVRLLELHRLALDLATDGRPSVGGFLSRSADTARRLFPIKRQLVMLRNSHSSWDLVYAQGYDTPQTHHLIEGVMTSLLDEVVDRGWPSMERLGFRALLGVESSSGGEEQPPPSTLGLPFLWDGTIQGLYYIESEPSKDRDSSHLFSPFVDFLFTLTPHLRRVVEAT